MHGGSCSSKKNITINLNLVLKPQKCTQYVVLHEMCHLIYMNHTKKFWDLVEENCKDCKMIRKIMKEY